MVGLTPSSTGTGGLLEAGGSFCSCLRSTLNSGLTLIMPEEEEERGDAVGVLEPDPCLRRSSGVLRGSS